MFSFSDLEIFADIYMENIVIKGNKKMPSVNFDAQEGMLEISGRSIVENAPAFYEPLIQWIDLYAKQMCPKTVVNIKMDYFNTSSSKWIFTMVKKIRELYDINDNVEINWYYDDDDILEYAEIIQKITKLPIKMIHNII